MPKQIIILLLLIIVIFDKCCEPSSKTPSSLQISSYDDNSINEIIFAGKEYSGVFPPTIR